MRAIFIGCVAVGCGVAAATEELVLDRQSQFVDDAVSLLQRHVHKHGSGGSLTNPDMCRTGLRNGHICYGDTCGRGGGMGCSSRPGGRHACCASQITRSGRRCTGPNQQRCVIPSRRDGMSMGGPPVDEISGESGNVEEVPEPTEPPQGEPEEPSPIELVDPVQVEELGLCESTLVFREVLHSNLGGAGPDEGEQALIFGDVAPETNLVVTSTSTYTPNTLNVRGGVLHNGVRDGFGVINLASGSSVDLNFQLVDKMTGEPKILSDFVFTFFDGDHGMGHESREAVKVDGFTSYVIADESNLEVDQIQMDLQSRVAGSGIATFTSKMRGDKTDNPTDPFNMNVLQKRRSVALLFENKSEFEVTASESGYENPQGRNILFAGASSLICNNDSPCLTHTCPDGMRSRQNAEFLVCATSPCTDADTDHCCLRI